MKSSYSEQVAALRTDDEELPMSTQEPASATAIPELASLPRIEDLPQTPGGGYDPDRVRDAFDAFRRHAVQLQAQLRVLRAALGPADAGVDEPLAQHVRVTPHDGDPASQPVLEHPSADPMAVADPGATAPVGDPAPAVPAEPAEAPLATVSRLDPAAPADEPVPEAGLAEEGRPREWGLAELEQLARARAGEDVVRDEERGHLLAYLREFATPAGTLPRQFDELVRESFGDLLGARTP